MAVVLALSNGRSSSQMAPLRHTAPSFILSSRISMGPQRVERGWLPSRSRHLQQCGTRSQKQATQVGFPHQQRCMPCRRVKSRLSLPWLVVILLIDEKIQLETSAAAHAKAFTFALCERPSEALHLCQDQVVPPVRAAGHPSHPLLPPLPPLPGFGVSLCTIMCDDGLRSDSLENEFLQPMLKTSRGQGEVLHLVNVRCINLMTVVTTAACDLRFERFGLPVLCWLRHDAASH